MPTSPQELKAAWNAFTPEQKDEAAELKARGVPPALAIRQVREGTQRTMDTARAEGAEPTGSDKAAAFGLGFANTATQGLANKGAGLWEMAKEDISRIPQEGPPIARLLGLSSAKPDKQEALDAAYLRGHDEAETASEDAEEMAPGYYLAGQGAGIAAPIGGGAGLAWKAGKAALGAPAAARVGDSLRLRLQYTGDVGGAAANALRLGKPARLAASALRSGAEGASGAGLYAMAGSESGTVEGAQDDALFPAVIGGAVGTGAPYLGRALKAGWSMAPDKLKRAVGIFTGAGDDVANVANVAKVAGGPSSPAAPIVGTVDQAPRGISDDYAAMLAEQMDEPVAKDVSKTLRLGADKIPVEADLPTLRLSPSAGDAIPDIGGKTRPNISKDALDFIYGGENPGPLGKVTNQTRPSPYRPPSANEGISPDDVQRALRLAEEDAAQAQRLSAGTNSMRRPDLGDAAPAPEPPPAPMPPPEAELPPLRLPREQTSTNVGRMRQQLLDELDGPGPAVEQQAKARRARARPKKTKGQLVGKKDPPMGPGRKNDLLAEQPEDPMAGLGIGRLTGPAPSTAPAMGPAMGPATNSDALVSMAQMFPPGAFAAPQFRTMGLRAGLSPDEIERAISVLQTSGYLR